MNILITGGSSGIGEAITRRLAKNNFVIICGRNVVKLSAVMSSCRNSIKARICDVSNESDVEDFVSFAKDHVDYIDVIINCAGSFGEIGRFDKTDSEEWLETVKVNLFGTYLITKHFLPLLLRSKTRKIINFAGGGAFDPFPNYSAYAVSKAGVVRLTENIAVELRHLGVTANCIAPGFIATPIHDKTLEAGKEKAGEQYNKVVEKMSEGDTDKALERVADCVEFLISPKSCGLTGKTISVGFDKWDTEEFKKLIPDINRSDLYTLRRMNLENVDSFMELSIASE